MVFAYHQWCPINEVRQGSVGQSLRTQKHASRHHAMDTSGRIDHGIALMVTARVVRTQPRADLVQSLVGAQAHHLSDANLADGDLLKVVGGISVRHAARFFSVMIVCRMNNADSK
ncbi:hypothetical protein EC912_101787 [Luteibacter rhizovicinus]|uniref:Uncharacterized protein n=1 Tax=Luteibacter rhizovicinus TaxID=242606 RepID=A0A4R3YYN5_9GAMM|nr:hypothetical protein EC912_101787 [Luteibacter rhizovicinus]